MAEKGSRKAGRNKAKCARYRDSGRYGANKKRRSAKPRRRKPLYAHPIPEPVYVVTPGFVCQSCVSFKGKRKEADE